MQAYDGSLHQVCECEKCGAVKRRLAISIYRAQLQVAQVIEGLTSQEEVG